MTASRRWAPFAMVIWVAGTMFKDLGHTDGQISLDMQYWAANRDEIATRWYAWQAK